MNKKIIALLLVFCLAVTGVFAASNVQFKASVSPSLTGMSFTFQSKENSNRSTFSAGLKGDFAAIFKNGLGPYVAFNGQFTEQSYGLVAGIAYMTKLNNNIDLMATGGLALGFGSTRVGNLSLSSGTSMGIQVMCNFDFKMTQSMFVRLGIGTDIYFVTFPKSGNAITYFSMNVPIPSFSIGWKF